MESQGTRALSKAKRIVIKLGSHVVTHDDHSLNEELFNWLAKDVAWLHSKGIEVAIVSSGAVAAGLGRLGLVEPPATIPEKQAVAAVGQLDLMWSYGEVFGANDLIVGQVLLTRDDFANRRRYQNARNTLVTLFKKGVVPIINENDTVVVDEIKFGDNDNLSAMVANLIEADCLFIFSDVEGLYDKDPKASQDARLLHLVEKVDDVVEGCATDSKTCVGTGGMSAKLTAVKRAVHGGVSAVVASGRTPHILRHLMEDKEEGTYFPAMQDTLTRRKHWIAYTVKSVGTITIDDGAVKAILAKGKSLLPKGIVSAEGDFDRGDAVKIVTNEGVAIAKGLTNYSMDEVLAIAGLASWEIVDKLGYKFYDEVIHRDDLVLLQP